MEWMQDAVYIVCLITITTSPTICAIYMGSKLEQIRKELKDIKDKVE